MHSSSSVKAGGRLSASVLNAVRGASERSHGAAPPFRPRVLAPSASICHEEKTRKVVDECGLPRRRRGSCDEHGIQYRTRYCTVTNCDIFSHGEGTNATRGGGFGKISTSAAIYILLCYIGFVCLYVIDRRVG